MMELVSTVTVGSGGAAYIEWTSIPQTGTDLLILFSGRTDRNTFGYGDGMSGRFNSDSGSNYAIQILWGTPGDSPSAYGQKLTLRDNVNLGSADDTGATSNTFSNVQTLIPNYTVSNSKVTATDGVIENNATRNSMQIQAGSWSQSSAITSIRFQSFGQNFVQHTTASLYIIS